MRAAKYVKGLRHVHGPRPLCGGDRYRESIGREASALKARRAPKRSPMELGRGRNEPRRGRAGDWHCPAGRDKRCVAHSSWRRPGDRALRTCCAPARPLFCHRRCGGWGTGDVRGRVPGLAFGINSIAYLPHGIRQAACEHPSPRIAFGRGCCAAVSSKPWGGEAEGLLSEEIVKRIRLF